MCLLRELNRRALHIVDREKTLKRETGGLTPSGGVVVKATTKKAKQQARKRSKQPPKKEKTEKEREAEKKSLTLSKAAVDKSMGLFVRHIVALVTSEEWRWMDEYVNLGETEGQKDSEKKRQERIKRDLTRRANEAAEIMSVADFCDSMYPDLVLFIFENAFVKFAEGQSLEDAST